MKNGNTTAGSVNLLSGNVKPSKQPCEYGCIIDYPHHDCVIELSSTHPDSTYAPTTSRSNTTTTTTTNMAEKEKQGTTTIPITRTPTDDDHTNGGDSKCNVQPPSDDGEEDRFSLGSITPASSGEIAPIPVVMPSTRPFKAPRRIAPAPARNGATTSPRPTDCENDETKRARVREVLETVANHTEELKRVYDELTELKDRIKVLEQSAFNCAEFRKHFPEESGPFAPTFANGKKVRNTRLWGMVATSYARSLPQDYTNAANDTRGPPSPSNFKPKPNYY